MAIKRSAAGLAALLFAGSAAAQEFQSPRFVLSTVDWDAAAKSVPDPRESTIETFAALNKALGARFTGIDKSTVPVLLPVDLAALRKDKDDEKPEVATSNKYFGGFNPSKFFLAGPAGYDATFWIDAGNAGFDFQYLKPIEIELGGAAYIYDLPGPNHQEVFPPPKEFAEKFPGMQRILRENHVRYVFERFGAPYIVSIQCYDRRPSRKYLSCREADPVAQRFLSNLATAGGTPGSTIPEPKVDLTRPQEQSSDFTYFGPGDLISNSGWHKMPGRADYNVYARIRFPIADAPAYIKSQSFMPWGDCYRTGRIGRIGRKGAPYHCRVNDKPLVFDESAAENWTYPWRDNFCEMRDFLVGQCPGGYGHQGEDMRPANCVLKEANADRCLPYQHTIAAVHDGVIWRSLGNLGLYVAFNNENEHVRFRYLHMNPNMMDGDGLLSGRAISEGEIVGKVATWGDGKSGTSYHLHFNLQVFTKVGWVWVNPYMTLVAAYERLIGGRGIEIKPGDPAPPIPDKPPVILNPSTIVTTPAAPPTAVVPHPTIAVTPAEKPNAVVPSIIAPEPKARKSTAAKKPKHRNRPHRHRHHR
ncbi:MAG: M23 family peptidase [Pseudolabrys sp.]